METLMHEPIRDVVARYPAIGGLLAANNIDCTTCTVGNCLLKDVMKVHGLSAQQEVTLLAEIQNLMHHVGNSAPTSTIALGSPNMNPFSLPDDRAQYSGGDAPNLCDPILQLIVEHERVLRMLNLVPQILARDSYRGEDRAVLEDFIHHSHHYADRFHHGKEEDILFKMTDSSLAIVQAMLADHASARAYLKMAEDGLHGGDTEMTAEGLRKYADLMRNHIRRENDIMFPWLDRTITAEQKSELMEKFDKVDTREGSNLEAEVDAFIETAEQKLLSVKSTIYPIAATRERTIERLVDHPHAAISHIILPAGDMVEGHMANTHVYFIITHGMVTVRHSQTQEEKYVQGNIVHLPPDTWMELRNDGPGTFEMFVIRAPNIS